MHPRRKLAPRSKEYLLVYAKNSNRYVPSRHLSIDRDLLLQNREELRKGYQEHEKHFREHVYARL